MSRHERNRAYKEAINSGKSKDEAIAARQAVKSGKQSSSEAWDAKGREVEKKAVERLSPGYAERGWDFDSDLNGNGTDWHTAEDL